MLKSKRKPSNAHQHCMAGCSHSPKHQNMWGDLGDDSLDPSFYPSDDEQTKPVNQTNQTNPAGSPKALTQPSTTAGASPLFAEAEPTPQPMPVVENQTSSRIPAYRPQGVLNYAKMSHHHHHDHHQPLQNNRFHQRVKANMIGLLQNQKLQTFQIMIGVAPITFCLIEGVLKIKLPEGEHSHEGVLVDFDEAAHGLYAFLKNTGNLENFSAELKIESELLTEAPSQFLQHELKADGVADLSILAAVSAPMLVFAFLAAKAGWEEFNEAKHDLLHLYEDLDALKKQKQMQTRHLKLLTNHEKLTNQQALPTIHLETYRQRLISTQAKMRQKMDEKKLLKYDERFGLASFLSGSTIILKVLAEGGTKLATFFGAPLTKASAMGVGLSSQVVLAPLTGIFAGALGWFSHQKTKRQFKSLRLKKYQNLCDFNHFKDVHDSFKYDPTRIKKEKKEINIFKHFLKIKNKARESFFRRYKIFNKIFMAGAALYTAVGLFKATLIIMATAGVGLGALAEPATAGCLLAGLSLGGVIMGLGSIGFILGHPKQGRYQKEALNALQENIQDLHAQQKFALSMLDLPQMRTQNFAEGLRERLSVYALRYHAQFYQSIHTYCDSIDDVAQTIAIENDKMVENRSFSEDRKKTTAQKKINTFKPSFKNTEENIEKNIEKNAALKQVRERFKIWRHHKKQNLMAGFAFLRTFIKSYTSTLIKNQSTAATNPQPLTKSKYQRAVEKAKKASHARYDQGLKTLSQGEFVDACTQDPSRLHAHFASMLKRAIITQRLELENRIDQQTVFNSPVINSSDHNLSDHLNILFAAFTEEERRKKKEAFIAGEYFERLTKDAIIEGQQAHLQRLINLQTALNELNKINQAERLTVYQDVIEALDLLSQKEINKEMKKRSPAAEAATQPQPQPQPQAEHQDTGLIYDIYLKKISAEWLLNFPLRRQQRNCLVFA